MCVLRHRHENHQISRSRHLSDYVQWFRRNQWKTWFGVLRIVWNSPWASQIVKFVDHAYHPHLIIQIYNENFCGVQFFHIVDLTCLRFIFHRWMIIPVCVCTYMLILRFNFCGLSVNYENWTPQKFPPCGNTVILRKRAHGQCTLPWAQTLGWLTFELSICVLLSAQSSANNVWRGLSTLY